MKIGTRVKIIDVLKHFPCYTEMFKKMGFNGADIEREIRDLYEVSQIKFVVFSIIKDSRGNFYGIIDKKGNQYLFQKEGLQKIKRVKNVKEDTIKEQEEAKVKSFPKVMKSIYSDLHVLFESEKIGQVVISDDRWYVGHISEYWSIDTFEDIKEPITITFN